MYTKPQTWKDCGILLSAWGSAVAIFLTAVFGWDLEKYVGPFVAAIMMTAFLAWNLWGIWKNTYVSKQAQQLKENALKAQGLMKK